MRASVVRPDELGPAELIRWRAMQDGIPELMNPFLSPEFACAVGRSRSSARVAILEEESEVVGFFPFELRALGIARAIGWGLSDCQGLIHADDWTWDPQELLVACNLKVWEFDHLMTGQKPFEPYHAVRARSPIIGLEQGYESYLENRRRGSKRIVKDTLYKGRKLKREVGEVIFDFDCRDHGQLKKLMEWKSAQYRRTLRHDRFAQPAIVRIIEDLFDNRTAECAATLSMLYAGGRPIAGHLGLRSKSILAYWFPAYDVEFASYSPGLLLNFHMAEAAAEQGIRHIDLGKGDHQYKDSLCSGELHVAEGWVERPSAIALLRRVQRTPRHRAVQFIVSHPKLLDLARRTLKGLGRLKSGVLARRAEDGRDIHPRTARSPRSDLPYQ